MQNISSTSDLRNAIEILKQEQLVKGQILKEQLNLSYQSFKPANLIKNTLKSVIATPLIVDSVINTAIGLATGYISNKIIVGGSSNIVRRILGFLVQSKVSDTVMHNADSIKSFGKNAFNNIFKKKDS